MLEVGDHIPDFTLPNSLGEDVHIRDVLAKGPVVIFFYPKDNTRGCTREACRFRDRYKEFTDAGATVIDRKKAVRKRFGVRNMFLGLVPGRVTFVAGPDGVVQHVFNSQTQAERHVEEALRVVRSMQPSPKTANG
jgi:peroxiredoxin Q/BCP